MRKGQIVGFRGTQFSPQAVLVVKRDTGKVEQIPCSNIDTVKLMDRAYGGIIQSGLNADVTNAVGKIIYYDVDDWGNLKGFVPSESASEEVVRKYQEDRARQKLSKKVL